MVLCIYISTFFSFTCLTILRKNLSFFKENLISYAKIGASILNADGIKDYSNLLVNNDTDNIALTDNNTTTEIAVLGTVTLIEQE